MCLFIIVSRYSDVSGHVSVILRAWHSMRWWESVRGSCCFDWFLSGFYDVPSANAASALLKQDQSCNLHSFSSSSWVSLEFNMSSTYMNCTWVLRWNEFHKFDVSERPPFWASNTTSANLWILCENPSPIAQERKKLSIFFEMPPTQLDRDLPSLWEEHR